MTFFFELDYSTMRTFDGFGDAVLAEAVVVFFVGGVLGLGWSLSLWLGFDSAGGPGLIGEAFFFWRGLGGSCLFHTRCDWFFGMRYSRGAAAFLTEDSNSRFNSRVATS